MMAVRILYLDWDSEDADERARDIHHQPEEHFPTAEDLDECYRELDLDLEYMDIPLESAVLEAVWEDFNRGPDGYDERLDELEERSMAPGDVVEIDGQAYMCAPFGWEEVPADE